MDISEEVRYTDLAQAMNQNCDGQRMFNNKTLQLVWHQKDVKMLKFILSSIDNIDINYNFEYNNGTVLHCAVERTPTKVHDRLATMSFLRQLLRDNRIDVNARNTDRTSPYYSITPVQLATRNEFSMRLLLQCKHNVDVNVPRGVYGETVLHRAVMYGKLMTIRQLLQYNNIDVSLMDEDGCTALMNAEQDLETRGNKYFVVALIQHASF